MNTARDNFFKECPAVMDYSSFTDYRTAHRREQNVRMINGITNDYDYKNLLQQNAEKIMNSTNEYNKIAFGCTSKQCIHNSPTSPPPGDFNTEMYRYNQVRVGGKTEIAKCNVEQQYRMS
jgi:hypothetical protein